MRSALFIMLVLCCSGCLDSVEVLTRLPSDLPEPTDDLIEMGEADLRDVPADLPPPLPISDLAVGEMSTCVLRVGELWCWGNNDHGQLGLGDTTNRMMPVRVGEANDWTEIEGGRDLFCGIRGGQVYCWGINPRQAVAGNANTNVTRPSLISLPAPATDVSAGYTSACAILNTGQLWCWGSNGERQLGPSSLGNTLMVPAQVGSDENWESIACGEGHSCGVRGGELYCWGRNTQQNLGINDPLINSGEQRRVGMFSDWTRVRVAQNHSCALRNGNTMVCWGDNGEAQIRFPRTPMAPVGQPSEVDVGAFQVAVNAFNTCWVSAGEVRCRGRNNEGQLGLDPGVSSSPIDRTTTPGDWSRVGVGWFHRCALDLAGELYCWGRNLEGQLGTDGGGFVNFEPSRVVFPN